MKYTKEKDGYIVTSMSKSSKTYIVSLDLKSCTCPAFRYIMKGKGPCKHIVAILRDVGGVITEKTETQLEDGMDAVAFVEKHGEEILEALKMKGEVYEKNGKLWLLE